MEKKGSKPPPSLAFLVWHGVYKGASGCAFEEVILPLGGFCNDLYGVYSERPE